MIIGVSGAFVILFVVIAGPVNGVAAFAAQTFF